MRRQMVPALRMFLAMTLLVGFGYSAVVTGFAQVLFRDAADGSLVRSGGRVIGSALIGQAFTGAGYFHPRPSAVDYDGRASGASNLGPSNPEFLEDVTARVAAYRAENSLGPDVAIPVDAVTASASGRDPHISLRNARLQAPRVASARGLGLTVVLALVDEATAQPVGGFLSEPAVNVLALNLMVDEATGTGGSTLEP